MSTPKKDPKDYLPRGRRPSFNSKFHPKWIKSLFLAGMTRQEIADELGISKSNLYVWLNKYPDIMESVKKAQEIPDASVERSLFERARGYSVMEDKVTYDTQLKEHVRTSVRRDYPPDPTAMIFWLKNRQPDRWREKQTVEHTGGLTFTAPNALADEGMERTGITDARSAARQLED